MKRWTVRLINYFNDPERAISDHILEQFRYMGIAREIGRGTVNSNGEIIEYNVIEIDAPDAVKSIEWANANAARMASFGYNATAAPKWETGDLV